MPLVGILVKKMPDFKNTNSLFEYIKQQVIKGMQDDVARHVRDTVQKYLLSTVYANPHNLYERTAEVLRALTIDKVETNGDEVSVRIYIDADKIIPRSGPDGMWGIHQSFDGSSYNEQLPFLLEYGNKKPNPYYNTPSFEYMQLSIDELKQTKEHMHKLIGYLKTKGIKVQ